MSNNVIRITDSLTLNDSTSVASSKAAYLLKKDTDSKVSKSGDTVTGNLVIDGDLYVAGKINATIEGSTESATTALKDSAGNVIVDTYATKGELGTVDNKIPGISSRVTDLETRLPLVENPVATGSITARTLQDRFADVVNVKDFGAKGDGIADDTAAIQAALEAAVGNLLYFPDGVYIIQETLHIGVNTYCRGSGNAIIKKNFMSSSNPAYGVMVNDLGLPKDNSTTRYNGNSNITIDNLVFEGEFFETPEVHTEYGVAFAHCENITVKNCEFRYFGHSHLTEFSGVRNGLVENCKYHHLSCDVAAVELGEKHRNEIIQLDSCSVYSTPIPEISAGDDTPNTDIIIRNCVIGSEGDYYGIAIGTYSVTKDVVLSGLTIESCKITNADIAINLTNYTNVDVFNCVCTGSKDRSVYVYGNTTGTCHFDNYNIIDNYFESEKTAIDYNAIIGGQRKNHVYRGNTFVGKKGVYSYIQDVDSVTFSDNTHEGNTLKILGTTNTQITNNKFLRNNGGSDTYTGALVLSKSTDGTPENALIAGNTFVDCDTIRGIRVDYLKKVSIIGNTFRNCGLGYPSIDCLPITILYGAEAYCAGNLAYDIPVNSGLLYADGSSIIVDGGNFSDKYKGSINASPIKNDRALQVANLYFYNTGNKSSLIDIIYPVNLTSQLGTLNIGVHDLETDEYTRKIMFSRFGAPLPVEDNTLTLGYSSNRWSQVYAGTGTINTSDSREKTSVTAPDEALMRAWSKVNFKAFQFTDAVEKKGENARIHFGVIAQQVAEAFASEGLDASRYALFCYDKWDDQYEEDEIVDVEAVLDEAGNEVTPAVTHIEKRLVTPAGDRYGIRYSEALALECAYQRWRLDKLEEKLSN